MKKFVLLILCGMLFANAPAQVGSPDQAFGNNGIRFFPATLKILPAPGNQHYVITGNSNGSPFPIIVIKKYLSDGTLDPSYGNGGISDGVIMNFADAALQKDGKIVLAGTTYYSYLLLNPLHDVMLVARFTTGGALDPSFNQDGVVTKYSPGFFYSYARKVIVNDNYIAVEGYNMSPSSSLAYCHVDRLDMNGNYRGFSLIGNQVALQNFNAQFYTRSIAFQDDKLLVASVQPDLTGLGKFYKLYRFLANNTPDPSFGQQGVTTLGDSIIRGKAFVAPQGNKILVTTHSFDQSTSRYGFAVTRYNQDGTTDVSFGTNGWQFTYFANSLAAAPSSILSRGDTIYIGGNRYNAITKQLEIVVVRYTGKGSIDSSFDADGMQAIGNPNQSYTLNDMSVEANRLVLGGYFTDAQTGVQGNLVAKYLLESSTISLTCHADTVLATDPGKCEAVLNGIDPTVSGSNNGILYTLSGATTGNRQGSASGVHFNKGITTVKYSVIADPSKNCSFNVTVKDMEAPLISAITTNPTYLWPANHKMVDVQLSYTATDNCGPVNTVITVTSTEAASGTDKDDVKGDWLVVDAHLVKLRAERSGKAKKGRVYTITITVTDAAGNSTTSQVNVMVPHNAGSVANITGLPYRRDEEETLAPQFQVKVLPNPSTTYFTLVTGSNSKEKISLRVINQLGATVETRTNIAANSTVQLGHTYRDGIYIVELVQGEQRAQVKLVKIK